LTDNPASHSLRASLQTTLSCTLTAFLCIAGLTYCTDDATAPKADEHSRAKELWRQAGIHDYDLTQWRDCYCILGGREVLLQVRASALSSGTLVEEGRDLSMTEMDWYCSVDSLFSFIEQARVAAPASLIVEYDALLGYPLRISVDYSTQIADDEITFRSAKLNRR
jgi:hypothetical protein